MADANPNVEYRPVPGFPGYEVGSDGSYWKGHRQLDPYLRRDGRMHVEAWRGNHRKRFLLHRLVLIAFVGPCPEGMECCHNDGNPLNNELSNLRWDTHTSNLNDKLRHGTDLRGERAPRSKLTEAQALEAIRLIQLGEKHKSIGMRFGVSRSSIQMLATGKTWAHLPRD